MTKDNYTEGYKDGYRDGFKDGRNGYPETAPSKPTDQPWVAPEPYNPIFPKQRYGEMSCPVCGISGPSLYVCPRSDCPSRITC